MQVLNNQNAKLSIDLTKGKEELREKFASLQTPQDVADLLEIPYSLLVYHLYKTSPVTRYTVFEIPKKSGGKRRISAPNPSLKIIQKKLNEVLTAIYPAHKCAHGFILDKNIVTNASVHSSKRFVLNVDLKDFFPSINFGRVRGIFTVWPCNLNSSVATVLAQICCHGNALPQGAPTSPIISNLICRKMDSELKRLARVHNCIYTRYADDLSFSYSGLRFPRDLARATSDGDGIKTIIGGRLKSIIEDNGFRVNEAKVRLQKRIGRQEVTGLTVNKFPNVERKFIRQIRAMLHAWERYGIEAAEREFLEKYDKKHRLPSKEKPLFESVVRGKIAFVGMVKQKNHPVYLKLIAKFDQLQTESSRATQ